MILMAPSPYPPAPHRRNARPVHRALRRAAVALVLVATGALALTGCGGEGGDSYATQVSGLVERLSSSATAMSGSLLAASTPADVKAVQKSATSQFRLVSEVLQSVTTLNTPSGLAATTTALRQAVLSNRKYLAALRAAAGPDPSAGLRAMPRAKRDGAAMLGDYRKFFAVAPAGTVDGISDVGVTDLAGLAKAQRSAQAGTAPSPTPAPTAPPPEGEGPAAMSDVVANSGGEGVRYRYSPSLSDLVPGNGPFEGDSVAVTCFTSGETVKGNSWWARLTNGYYVPATFLLYGSSGPSSGAPYC